MEPVTSQDPRRSVLLASINDLKPKTRQLETTFFFVKIVSEMEGFPQKKGQLNRKFSVECDGTSPVSVRHQEVPNF